MLVSHVEADNFRSFQKVGCSFSKNLNTIIGPNGSGKTNLLELIYFSLTGKGLRTTDDLDLLLTKTDFLRTESKYSKDGIAKTIKILFNKENGKDITLNGRINEKTLSLFYESNLVVFSPSSSQLIKGGPAIRRNFLDRILMKLNKEFSMILSKYAQTLRNRNAVLKRRLKESGDDHLYEILTQNIVSFSQIIQEERKKMVEIFNESIIQSTQTMNLSDLADIKFIYSPFYFTVRYFDQLRYDEIKKGISLIGSHLDQVHVKKDDLYAKSYCSEGEQKLITFLCKLCEFKLIEKMTKNVPILLLDDLSSELDDENALKAIHSVRDRAQIFLTSLHSPILEGETNISLERNQREIWIQ